MISGRYPMHINGLVENLDEIVRESVKAFSYYGLERVNT